MKASEVLEILKEAAGAVRKAGASQVPVENLERFTAELERTASASPEGVSAGDASMEEYKAKLAALGNSLQQQHESNLEMFRTVITTGQSALKSALLINGGAAIALLAFVGHVWGNANAAHYLPSLIHGLLLFVWGVLSAACAAGATYLSQAGYGGAFGAWSTKVAYTAHGLAIVCVVGAYVLFGLAAWQTFAVVSG